MAANKPMGANPAQMAPQSVIINNPGVNSQPQMMAANPMQAGAGMIVNKPPVQQQQQQQPNQQQQQAGAMNPQMSNQQLKMQLQQQIRPPMQPGQPQAQYHPKCDTASFACLAAF